ncbi:MAG: OsmC family protein [Proteobacteria bacterium]|nr:OsmC family protein [Pseudomonadota bacterium]
MAEDDDLLEPSIDPKKRAIGIRRVTAVNEASTRSVMTVRGHTVITDEKESDTGPTPLELTLASLNGCEGVIINRCAQAMGFKYSGVEIESEGEVDQRGSRGVRGVRPYFNWVKMTIRVKSSETPERFAKLAKNVEFRCPVMNLFRSADVEVTADWQLVAEDA